MFIVLLKTFHYLAILFAGGVLVGGGLIQAVFTRANQVPDINVSKVLKILGYLGLGVVLLSSITILPSNSFSIGVTLQIIPVLA